MGFCSYFELTTIKCMCVLLGSMALGKIRKCFSIVDEWMSILKILFWVKVASHKGGRSSDG